MSKKCKWTKKIQIGFFYFFKYVENKFKDLTSLRAARNTFRSNQRAVLGTWPTGMVSLCPRIRLSVPYFFWTRPRRIFSCPKSRWAANSTNTFSIIWIWSRRTISVYSTATQTMCSTGLIPPSWLRSSAGLGRRFSFFSRFASRFPFTH